MKVRTETRYNGAVAILRGPLVYSLKMGKRFEQLKRHHPALPMIDWAIHPTTPWNYGLLLDRHNPERSTNVVRTGKPGKQPFAQQTAPVVLRVKARAVPDWTLEASPAGQTPTSPADAREPLTVLVVFHLQNLLSLDGIVLGFPEVAESDQRMSLVLETVCSRSPFSSKKSNWAVAILPESSASTTTFK